MEAREADRQLYRQYDVGLSGRSVVVDLALIHRPVPTSQLARVAAVSLGFGFAFAWLLGVAFQYFTIVPVREIGKIEGVWAMPVNAWLVRTGWKERM